MNNFNEFNIDNLTLNPFNKIGKDWMLLTAKYNDKINTMTASWGGLGFMWGKNVAFTVIRPQRYTKEFIDNSDNFSICFFDENYKNKYKKAMSIFFTHYFFYLLFMLLDELFYIYFLYLHLEIAYIFV